MKSLRNPEKSNLTLMLRVATSCGPVDRLGSRRFRSGIIAVSIQLVLLVLSGIPTPAIALTITDSVSGSAAPTQVPFPPAPGQVVNGDFLIEPNPGCTGPATNCGMTGDGINDQTTWTFDFRSDPDYSDFMSQGTLTSASLSLTLTVREAQINTDVLRIRGLSNITAQIQQLTIGQTATITFDLLDFYTSNEIFDNLDSTLIAGSLPKNAGELLMLYQDDAVVSNAALSLSNNAVPIPAAVWLFGSGLLGLVGIARRKRAA